ncbi:hypothetical protein MP477_07330 [Chryseobacterium sp. WG23]|uniref:hypothetical protein n=1 Tax=Chryseobacterium sp. WG23 TaxID=2926910 RepID=UPI00211E5340|nr:hypothetical protein [Chryseobacterium sp. WG23]MCQ9634766.1 hypothetical protein [Chryseobacterium sp. WG23]
MKAQDIELLLKERVTGLELKKTAFESLTYIFLNNAADKNFLCGFEQQEIKTIFDGYQYLIDRRFGSSIIRTRIGLYIENEIYLDNLEPIGYYELETDLDGEVLDDWFVIEKEKH